MWDIEQKGNELLVALEKEIRSYTDKGTKLKILPYTSKNANGQHYDIVIGGATTEQGGSTTGTFQKFHKMFLRI